MEISIHRPLYVNKIGKRAKNQDSLYPSAGLASRDSHVFLACDGVGGAASGEIASRVSADVVGQFFEHQLATIEHINAAINAAQAAIDAHLETDPLSKGMGTTLTFVQFNPYGATIAHIGDSRVYHIRNGHILFCTDDHSLINEMRKKGMDNLENVQSNVITRAIQGQSVRAVQADVQFISDIEAGDYFFLCTDGIWGVFEDTELKAIFGEALTNEEKLEQIEARCAVQSHDNYTAYLIQIESVTVGVQPEIEPVTEGIQPEIAASSMMDNQSTADAQADAQTDAQTDAETDLAERQEIMIEVTQKPRKAAWVVPLILILLVLMGILWAVFGTT